MNKFESFRDRWNGRASDWDSEISKPEHYVNFEDGYQKFLSFEEKILDYMGEAETGIDLGCGTAVAAGPLSKKVENLYLLDLAESMLKKAKDKFPKAILLHASVTDIPLESESVDYAVSRGVVISHLPQGEQGGFLCEVQRILKPGGIFIFDFLNNMKTADFHLSSEKTLYTNIEIVEELKSFGFDALSVDGDENSRVVRIATRKD